jgi:uncharacterized protein (DUF362 family)
MSTVWQIYNRNRSDIFRDVAALIEASGALDWLGEPEAPLILKPNLVVAREASEGATTTPAVAEALVRYLQDHGFRNLIIAEGSWIGDSTRKAFRVCGYQQISRKYHVPLVDLQKDEYVSIEVDDPIGILKVCRTVAMLPEQGGSLVNLPLVKGHGQTLVTCALKNLKGCIPDSEKRRYHSLGVHKPVALLNTLIQPAFALADGLNPDPGWEEGGNPLKRDLLMLARDPVAMDVHAARLLKLDPADVPYIAMAGELGRGEAELSDEDIITLSEETGQDRSLKAAIERAQTQRSHITALVHQKDACSACFGNLASALRLLEEPGGEPLYIGRGFRGTSIQGTGIGSCLKGASRCLPGCPPSEKRIVRFLKSL